MKAGQVPVSPGGPTRMLAGCALTIIAGLQIVGVVSSTVIRHLIQTLPLWIVLWLGFRGSKWTRWAAFPVFAFWLALMAVAWGFLLGWTRIISGTFSPTEIAMTLVTGAAAVLGLVAALRDRRPADLTRASLLVTGVLLFQLGAFVLSFRPALAHDHHSLTPVRSPRSAGGSHSPSGSPSTRADLTRQARVQL